MKKISFITSLLLFSMLCLFATASTEQTLILIPQNGISSIPYDMAEAYSKGTDSTYSDINDSLFTINDSVEGSSKSWTVTIEAYGENSDGFYFVHETNKTVKKSYSLDVTGYKATRSSFSYGDASMQSSGSGTYSISKNSETKYTITYHGVSYSRPSWFSQYMANNIWYLNTYIVMAAKGSNEYLEEGNYYSYIHVYADKPTGNGSNGSSSSLSGIDEILMIKGYYGIDSGTIDVQSLSVIPGDDAYGINIQEGMASGAASYTNENKYEVAELNFYSSKSGVSDTSNYTSSKFKIYVSSQPDVNTSSTFELKKIGTENLTSEYGTDAVKYEIYSSVDGSTFTDLSSASTASGTGGVSRNSAGQICILPVYSKTQTKSSSAISSWIGDTDEYSITWSLSGLKLYIQLTDDVAKMKSGMYQDYIYIIVETNETT